MAKPYSISRLRANLYRLLDRVLETGVPLDVERKGRRVRIAPVDDGGRLAHLKPHLGYLESAPESLVHLDWSEEWRP